MEGMKRTLGNGLTAIVVPDHAAPVAAIQVWVRVGSADEREDEAGLAHLHEHMLFKGTDRRATGEIARDVEAHGGDINAWTSHDETVYHLVLASRFLPEGLDILADAIHHSAFDPQELARETEVVVDEIRRGRDIPARRLSEDLFALTYARHPYGRPVIGTEESVRGFTREKILAFYRRHYVPSRMTVVLVGDFDEEAASAAIERLFGGEPREAAPAEARTAEPPQATPRVRLFESDVREAHLALAWHTPAVRHEDLPALDLLSSLLGLGDSSRFALRITRAKLATEAYAYTYVSRDPGMLAAGLTVAGGQGTEALRTLLREIQRVREEPAPAGEIATLKRQAEAEAIWERETVQGHARRLGHFQTIAGGTEFEEEYQARVQAVTAEEIRSDAERFLTVEGLSLAGLLPQGFPLGEDEALGLAEEALRPPRRTAPASAEPAPAIRPARAWVAGAGPEPLRRVPLAGDTTLLLARDASVPVIALRAVWPGGVRWESEADNGAGNLIARLLPLGAGGKDAEEIARAIDGMAGSLEGVAGRNSFGLQSAFLSRFAGEGLSLFLDCLLRPDLPEAEIEKERAFVLQEIAARDDHPSGVAFDLFARTLWKRHPYRLTTIGEATSVAALTRARLLGHRREIAARAPLTLAVAGDFDPDVVISAVRAALPERSRAPASAVPAEPPPEEPRRAERTLAKAQAHLVVGFQGARLADPERYTLEVLSSVLSGQGGRLFIELRDRRSMAYSIGSASVEGVDPGYFAVYLGTGPEKVGAALAAVREQLARVREEAIPEAELSRARAYLIGTHAIALQRRSATAAAIAFNHAYGLGADAHLHYAERIEAVTTEAVRAAAGRFLDPRGEVVAIVGPGRA